MITARTLHPQFVVDSDGCRQAVILPYTEYQELLADLSDSAVVAERREEDTISHEQLMKELESDGSV